MTIDSAPKWTLALPLATLTAMIAGAPEYRLWGAFPAACVFTAMQWFVPKCRFRRENYFTPVNLALLLMLLKLVVAPALIMLAGPQNEVLTSLPSMHAMEGALAIDTIAYVALCLGLAFAKAGGAGGAGLNLPTPDTGFVLAFAALGLAGFVAEFGSIGRIVEYFTEPSKINEIQKEVDGTLIGLLGTVLRPFLAFSLVAWWTRMSSRSSSVGRITLAAIAAATGMALANMTFNFNRAAFVFPLLTLASVYHNRIRKIPGALTASAALVCLPLLLIVSTYRLNLMAGNETTSEGAQRSVAESMVGHVQAYTVGPPFTGLFYSQLGWGERLYGGTTLVASVLSPVPVLGKGFRETNGPALFNRAIYGISGIEDQIIPFDAELFVNFHMPGVVIGFVILGSLLGKSEQWIAASGSSFAAFASQYAAIWGAMLAAWSISIYSQILIYFFGPVYLYVAASHAREWLRRVTNPRLGLVTR